MTASVALDWTAQLIEAMRREHVRWSALERKRFRESMELPQDLEFDALDFSAVVKNTKEDDDDV